MAECLASPRARLARTGAAGAARVRARHDIDAEAARLAELFAAEEITGDGARDL
jgi:hypothetical protein